MLAAKGFFGSDGGVLRSNIAVKKLKRSRQHLRRPAERSRSGLRDNREVAHGHDIISARDADLRDVPLLEREADCGVVRWRAVCRQGRYGAGRLRQSSGHR